jgi:hypothetical protein
VCEAASNVRLRHVALRYLGVGYGRLCVVVDSYGARPWNPCVVSVRPNFLINWPIYFYINEKKTILPRLKKVPCHTHTTRLPYGGRPKYFSSVPDISFCKHSCSSCELSFPPGQFCW